MSLSSMASAIASLDARTVLLNAGGAGNIKIFQGSAPAATTDADAGTLLAQLTLSATAFPGSVDDTVGNALATANTITADSSANNTGTAQYFRAYSGAGTCIFQGSCGTSAADMILNTTAVVAGAVVSCSAWTIKQPVA